MNFEQSLVYELSTIAGLEGKIFPLGAREGTKTPFVVYISSEGEEIRVFEGYTGDKKITCEIHVIGETYAQMKTYTNAIIDKIKTFRGRKIGDDGVYIKSVSYGETSEEHEKDLGFERSLFDVTVRI